jgi:hypothetical protein
VTHLYALERETFLVALTGHTGARMAAQDIVDKRLEELRTLRGESEERTSGRRDAETDSPWKPRMEPRGIEPLTFRLPSGRAPS